VNISDIVDMYRRLNWRDFFGRAMRRTFDFAIPQVSYSQAGEDVVVDSLLQGVGIIQPTYLELGTNHPKFGNNTYKFYRRGCHGVLVEADPSLIFRIRRTRPRDIVLNVGVGVGDQRSMKFYVFPCSAHNTFDGQEALARDRSENMRIKAILDIPLQTVNAIIAKHFSRVPDFLSIDVEGFDLAVLKSLDFEKHPIPIICAETCLFSENHIKQKDHAIEIFLATKGYFVYADTYINTIFVNTAWFHSVRRPV
jgi:FkbM family methyltransferase